MKNFRPLDIYDDMPPMMGMYITHYGWHFTKKAFEFAVNGMVKKNAVNGKLETIEPWSKEQVENILAKYGVKVENGKMYDIAFVANMAKADYFKSSITDEQHLALFVKDYIDDPDASDDVTFRRWVATTVGNGEPIDWGEIM